jgi:hypothetical protein
MRKVFSFLLLVSIMLACQKGENDPAISLISRKSRLSGQWMVRGFEGESNGVKRSFDGSKMNYTVTDSITISRDYTWEFTFTKEGGYTSTTTENFPADSIANRDPFLTTIISTGDWEFTGGNNTPNKSQLLLMTTEVQRTESDKSSNVNIVATENPMTGMVYNITGLSSKEMSLSYNEVISNAFGQSINSGELVLKKL